VAFKKQVEFSFNYNAKTMFVKLLLYTVYEVKMGISFLHMASMLYI